MGTQLLSIFGDGETTFIYFGGRGDNFHLFLGVRRQLLSERKRPSWGAQNWDTTETTTKCRQPFLDTTKKITLAGALWATTVRKTVSRGPEVPGVLGARGPKARGP